MPHLLEQLPGDEPRNGPRAEGEEHDEAEGGDDEEDADAVILLRVQVLRHRDQDAEDDNAGEPAQVEGAPTQAVHQRDGDEGHGHHDGADAEGGVLRVVLLDAGVDEEAGGVVEDGHHAGQLLGEVHGHGHQQSHPIRVFGLKGKK